jgi:molecular chaperone HscC
MRASVIRQTGATRESGNVHFGIDLGTTDSLLSVFRDGRPELVPNAIGQILTPSVVALRQGHLVVGEAERAIAISSPVDAASLFKRAMGTDRAYRLGRQKHSAPELSAMILAALKSDTEAHLATTVTDVVISVPAYFNELQRKAVRAAGRIAGLNVNAADQRADRGRAGLRPARYRPEGKDPGL